MQDADGYTGTQRETDDARTLKDCPFDSKPLLDRRILSRFKSILRVQNRPSWLPCRGHDCATISQQSCVTRSDKTGWHQQDQDEEEVRCREELRKCENVPDPA